MATMLRKGRIPVTDVNPHLLCVLCGGYFIDATTIIECLHSYCRTCIVRYLETSKMCPLCDVLVHKTKPLENLRADKTLQDLVYKLVPGLFESEMAKRRKFYEEHPEEVADASMEDRGEAGMEKTVDYEEEKISLVLELRTNGLPPGSQQNDEVADRRYLLCPSAVTVGHLKKFIRLKFLVPEKYQIQFFHTRLELTDNLTLCDIAILYTWRRIRPLRLFYMIYNPPPSHRKLALTPEEKRRRNSHKRKLSEDTEASIAERAAKIARKAADVLISSDAKSHYLTIGKHHDKSESKCFVTRDVNENCVIRQNKDLKNEVRPSEGKSRDSSTPTSIFIKPSSPVNGKHKPHHRSSDFYARSKFGKLDIYAKNSRKSKNSDSSKLLNDTKIVDSMKLLKINKNGDVYKCPSSNNTVMIPTVERTPRDKKTLIRPGKNIKVSDVRTHTSPDDVKNEANKNTVIIDIKRSVTKSPFKFLDTKNTVLVQCSLKNLSEDKDSDVIKKSESCKVDVISRDEADVKTSHKDKEKSVVKSQNKKSAKCEDMVQSKVDKIESSDKLHKQKNTNCEIGSKGVDSKMKEEMRNSNTISVSKQTEKHSSSAEKSSSEVVKVKQKKVKSRNSINNIFKVQEDKNNVLAKHRAETEKVAALSKQASQEAAAKLKRETVADVKDAKIHLESRSSPNMQPVTPTASSTPPTPMSGSQATPVSSSTAPPPAKTTAAPMVTPSPPAVTNETVIVKPTPKKSDFFAKQRIMPKLVDVQPVDSHRVDSVIKTDLSPNNKINPLAATDSRPSRGPECLPTSDANTDGKSVSLLSKINLCHSAIKPEKNAAEHLDANKNDINVKTPESKTEEKNKPPLPKLESKNDVSTKLQESKTDVTLKLNESKSNVPIKLDKSKNDVTVKQCESKNEKLNESKEDVWITKSECKLEASDDHVNSRNAKIMDCGNVTTGKTMERKHDVASKKTDAKNTTTPTKFEGQKKINTNETVNCNSNVTEKSSSAKVSSGKIEDVARSSIKHDVNTLTRQIKNDVTVKCPSSSDMTTKDQRNEKTMRTPDSRQAATTAVKHGADTDSHKSCAMMKKSSQDDVTVKSCDVTNTSTKDGGARKSVNESELAEKRLKGDVNIAGKKCDVSKNGSEHEGTKSKNEVSLKSSNKNNGVHADSSKTKTKATVSGSEVTNSVEEIDDSALCRHNSLIFKAGFATDPYSFEMDHQPLDLSDVSLKRCVKKSVILNK